MFAPPICRRSQRHASRTELILRHDRFVGSDDDGGYAANIAASEGAIDTASEASGAIKKGQDTTMNSRCFWRS
jgi:hypothetical protein